MNRILSFRPMLENLTREYSKNFKDPESLTGILGELIVGISAYREEGSTQVPLVFLSRNLQALLVSLKGNDAIPIGSGPIRPLTVRNLLKIGGPLGSGHEWAIYVTLNEQKETLHYGVFRTDRFPLHESSYQRLRTLTDGDPDLIGIQKIGENLIEIRNSSGSYHYIDASGVLELTQNPALMISHWVSAITETAPPSVKRKMESFYHRIGVDLLSLPHGTLAAIVPCGKSYPDFLKDGVVFRESFGLVRAVHRYVKYRDEATTLSLSSYGALIRKMMSMDGITVFDSSGEVLAYNCFVHESRNPGKSPHVLGGARKRAFEILCSHLELDLTCVLYRSQDGYGFCKKSEALSLRLNPLLETRQSFPHE